MAAFNSLKEGEVADIDMAGSTVRAWTLVMCIQPRLSFFHMSWDCLLKSKILQEGSKVKKYIATIRGGNKFCFGGG